jgi:hypothetical protein
MDPEVVVVVGRAVRTLGARDLKGCGCIWGGALQPRRLIGAQHLEITKGYPEGGTKYSGLK